MEKTKEMADKDKNNKERAKVKAKKMEDAKKKRQEKKATNHVEPTMEHTF